MSKIKQINTRRAAPHNRTDTSRLAAKAIEIIAGSLREKIYTQICGADEGLTNNELVYLLNIPEKTVTARANELWNGGFIADSGVRRKTPAGRKAKVWVSMQ